MCNLSWFSDEFIKVFGSGDYEFLLTVGYVYTISHCIFISWIIHCFLGTKEDHISNIYTCTYSGQNEFKLVLFQFSFLQIYYCIP